MQSYSLEEIKEIIERIETERVQDELSLLEDREGFFENKVALTERTKPYLEFLGMLSVGISVGVFSVIFNFILIVKVLHIEF